MPKSTGDDDARAVCARTGLFNPEPLIPGRARRRVLLVPRDFDPGGELIDDLPGARSLRLVVRDRGKRRVVTIEEFSSIPLRHLEPVRRPSTYRARQSMVGGRVVRSPGGSYAVWFESLLEWAHLRELDYEGVGEMRTQAVQVRWELEDGSFDFRYPDVVFRTAGNLCVLDVTSASIDVEKWEGLDRMAAACRAFGWTYELGTEIPTRRVRNLRFLEGFRDVPLTDWASEVLADPPGTLVGLARRLGDGSVGLARAMAAVWHREVHLDLEAPIEPWSALVPVPSRPRRFAWDEG